MESAPAIIPATIAATFNPAFAPTGPATFRCSATRTARSQSWARRITGTSPAHDTRFGSSNSAVMAFALCNNRISQMPFGLGYMASSETPSSQLRGHLPCHDTINNRDSSVDPGSALEAGDRDTIPPWDRGALGSKVCPGGAAAAPIAEDLGGVGPTMSNTPRPTARQPDAEGVTGREWPTVDPPWPKRLRTRETRPPPSGEIRSTSAATWISTPGFQVESHSCSSRSDEGVADGAIG